MKKRYSLKIICLIISVVLLLGTVIASGMISAKEKSRSTLMADALNYLGIFKGTEKGYRLEKTLNRAEAVTMIIRLMGKEKEALASSYDHPFNDVPNWADRYVAYAYEYGITEGKGEHRFAADASVRDCEFLTMLLRMLGFEDGAGGDFKWDSPYKLAKALGICENTDEIKDFVRGDVVLYCFGVLSSEPKKGGLTVAEALIASKAFSKKDYEQAMEIAGVTLNEAESTTKAPSTSFAPTPEITDPVTTSTTAPDITTAPSVTTSPSTTTVPDVDYDQIDTEGWSGIIVS